jgi:hypothetical protein
MAGHITLGWLDEIAETIGGSAGFEKTGRFRPALARAGFRCAQSHTVRSYPFPPPSTTNTL